MSLYLDDEVLRQAGLTNRDAQIEFACRLYQADRLSLPMAARLAGVPRPEFEGELRKRSIPVHTITMDDFRHDLRSLGIGESAR